MRANTPLEINNIGSRPQRLFHGALLALTDAGYALQRVDKDAMTAITEAHYRGDDWWQIRATVIDRAIIYSIVASNRLKKGTISEAIYRELKGLRKRLPRIFKHRNLNVLLEQHL